MSTLSLRLPDSLHRRVRELAQQDGISINQFISTAVAEKLSALLTEQYLRRKQKCGRCPHSFLEVGGPGEGLKQIRRTPPA